MKLGLVLTLFLALILLTTYLLRPAHCGQLTVNDSYEYLALLHALDSMGVEYQEAGERTVSYGCPEVEAVQRAMQSVHVVYHTGCGGQFVDLARQQAFVSSLEAEGIEHWIVPSDKGERVVCRAEDRARVSQIFRQVLGIRNDPEATLQ